MSAPSGSKVSGLTIADRHARQRPADVPPPRARAGRTPARGGRTCSPRPPGRTRSCRSPPSGGCRSASSNASASASGSFSAPASTSRSEPNCAGGSAAGRAGGRSAWPAGPSPRSAGPARRSRRRPAGWGGRPSRSPNWPRTRRSCSRTSGTAAGSPPAGRSGRTRYASRIACDVGIDVEVREHHALGLARAAAAEDDRRGVVDGHRPRGAGGSLEPVGPGRASASAAAADGPTGGSPASTSST